jgi:hypothetical protein
VGKLETACRRIRKFPNVAAARSFFTPPLMQGKKPEGKPTVEKVIETGDKT